MLKTTGTSLISFATGTAAEVPQAMTMSNFAAAKFFAISTTFALLPPAFSMVNLTAGSAYPFFFSASRIPFFVCSYLGSSLQIRMPIFFSAKATPGSAPNITAAIATTIVTTTAVFFHAVHIPAYLLLVFSVPHGISRPALRAGRYISV